MAGHILVQPFTNDLDCSQDGRIVLETCQFLVISKELLLTLTGVDDIHRGDSVLGNTQPLFICITVLIKLDGLLQCQPLVILFFRGIDLCDDKPLILMWNAWICGGLEPALAFLCQPIITAEYRLPPCGELDHW